MGCDPIRTGPMSADSDRTPKRYSARQLRELDLSVPDPRVVWATEASASSEWSSDYAASGACGPPDVFPRLGDHKGTWLSSSDDNAPWLDVTFPGLSEAVALIVCETCGPGSVVSVRDLDRGDELLREDQRVPPTKKGAQLLVIPLDPIAAVPRRVRLTLSGHKSDYQQIDAVGLITQPLDALMAAPPAPPPTTHRRYAPKEVPLHDLRGDPRLVWAKQARASSSYSSSYEAKEAVGRPNVFPKGGDQYKTWLSDNGDRNAWLEPEFAPTELCYGFVALEICGAGCIVRATDTEGKLLWSAKHEQVPSREARLLYVPLDPPRPLRKLRLWVSPAIDDYREIDAVALLTAPLEQLATKAPEPPPPPPPPVPGEPEGGFTQLAGVLLGPTPEAPLLHLTLRTKKGPFPMNRAGDVRLQLDTGREVTLEIDRTTVYGRPVLRREERFGELAAELPWLRDELGTDAPADDEEVVLEGEQLVGGESVHVAGKPTGLPSMGGFREAAGTHERLVAAAVANRPLSSTPFPKNGTREFHRAAVVEAAKAPRVPVPHPLARARRVAWWVTGAAALVFSLMAWLVGGQPVSGGLALEFGLALWATLSSLVLALEFSGRSAMITRVVGGVGQKRSGRVRFINPAWTATWTGIFAVCVGIPYGGIVSGLPKDALVPTVCLTLLLGGVHALVRVLRWQWADFTGLFVGLPLLLVPVGTLGSSQRGRFSGALEKGCRSSESFTAHSEYLGTTQSVDQQGRVTTHDRYRHWQTRSVSSSLGQGASLYLANGTLLQAGKVLQTVDVTLTPRATQGEVYASFASEHAPGDVAHLFGVARDVDGTWVVEPCDVLLGDMKALRRETVRHLGALFGLLFLVASGVAAALVLSSRGAPL